MKCECESIQEALSDAFDEGRRPDPELIQQARKCEECRHFLELWMDDGPPELALQQAPAGIALREEILNLPEQIEQGRNRPSGLWVKAVAAIALFAGIVTMLDLGPASSDQEDSALVEQLIRKSVDKEIEALETDIDKGMASLGTPLLALRESFAAAP